MKYIKKGKEPQNFSHWKATQKSLGVNYNYKSFRNPEKDSIHSSLLSEQGYICCYSCQRVDKTNSHIEHLAPQSKTDSESSLDYTNMLGSCGRDTNSQSIVGQSIVAIRRGILRSGFRHYKPTVKNFLITIALVRYCQVQIIKMLKGLLKFWDSIILT